MGQMFGTGRGDVATDGLWRWSFGKGPTMGVDWFTQLCGDGGVALARKTIRNPGVLEFWVLAGSGSTIGFNAGIVPVRCEINSRAG